VQKIYPAFEGFQAVPTYPSAGGIFERGKTSGSEKDKGLGSGLCCEKKKEVEHENSTPAPQKIHRISITKISWLMCLGK
jgi:hypothetical protein